MQVSGEELRLGLNAQDLALQTAKSRQTQPPERAFFGFSACSKVPGTYSCLFGEVGGEGGETTTQMTHGGLSCACFKMHGINNPAGTHSSCCIRIQLENIKMNCCRLENQLGKRGKNIWCYFSDTKIHFAHLK